MKKVKACNIFHENLDSFVGFDPPPSLPQIRRRNQLCHKNLFWFKWLISSFH